MMTAKSQQFLNELAQFYRNKGQHNVTPDNLIVRLNGKPVNLCDLYSSVIEMGGSYRVNQYNRWDEIYLKLFKPQPLGANVSVALRQIYQKYLLAYEKVNFSNFISDSIDNDDEESTNKEFNSIFSFSNHQVALNNQNRTNVNPLNKLFCSLMSDLPNEMDFGLRVATILTNSEKIDTLADFKFIDVIIECCILYICSCERTEYSKSTDYRFEEEELIELLNREDIKNLNRQEPHPDRASTLDHQKENLGNLSTNRSISNKFNLNNVRKFLPFKDCNCFIKFWSQMLQSNQDLLKSIFDLNEDECNQLNNENCCQQEHQKNYYKIKRIACLLKNVSYSIEKLRQDQQTYDLDEYERMPSGAIDNASINLLRFFILLLNSEDQFLINITLEIIANLSPLVNSNLPPLDQNTYIRLLSTIYGWCVNKVLNSSDLNCLNRCLEILTKLINSNHLAINRLIISEIFNQSAFFNRLTELLTCQHDVGVVVSALECCLTLSENYPKMLLNENRHLIKMLINLINCEEGKYFTLSSIRKVKIIDERRFEFYPTQFQTHHQQFQQIHHPQLAIQHHSQPQTILIQQPIQQQQQPILQQKPIQVNDLSNSNILAENEIHLKSWFYATFDPRPMNTSTTNKSSLKINEMYSDYVRHCCANGRRNVVTSLTFTNLLKKYFPSIVINQNDADGIVMKSNLNRINNNSNIQIVQPTTKLQIVNSTATVTSGQNLTSPILKAHLSTPPKANSSSSNKQTTTTTTTSAGNPSIINSNSNQSQQLINGRTTIATSTASPLIKNLLANKLRNNNQTTTTTTANSDDSKSNLLSQSSNTSGGNIIFTNNITNANQSSATAQLVHSANGPNLITVPLQQHIVPVSSSSNMIINTNQLSNQQGTMVLQPTGNSAGGQQQFLLVRTLLPQQNNTTNLIATSASPNQQPMRFVLPTSVITSQPSQTITINGTPTTTSTIITQTQQLTNNIDKQTPSSNNTNEMVSSTNEKDKLLKACLGSNVTSAQTNNTSNSSESNKSIVMTNNVKSSPLLNVLLDKGKLPEFSTVSNETSTIANNVQDSNKPIINNQVNHIVVNNNINNSLSSTTSALTTSNAITTSTLSTQIITTSSVNTNPPKMYILTTKSPLTIKNSTNIQTVTSNTAPIQSFIIQQQPSNTSTTGQPQQYILQQQNPVSQPLIVQQQQQSSSSNNLTNSTIQNPTSKSDQIAVEKQSNEIITNCVPKLENGEIFEPEENESNKKVSSIKRPIEEVRSPVLTNGCLEKENREKDEMQVDDNNGEKVKSPLLKRQLENDDSSCKKVKTDSQQQIPIAPITVIPVVQNTNAATIVKQDTINKVIVNNIIKPNESTQIVAVSSNGILPVQPTITNTIIKTALNNTSIPLATATKTSIVPTIKITKPNVIIQNSNSNKPQPQIITTNSTTNFKVITKPMQPVEPKLQYVCEWSNCKKSFEKHETVFLHVHRDHILPLEDKPTKCTWGGPDGIGPGCKALRPKYSLLTHLQDFHCGKHPLEQTAKRNYQLKTKGVTDIPPIVPPAHPGYAQNAAFLAIKRHSSTNVIETRPIANLSPLSKSVRLTAAMILRNLAMNSCSIKRLLKNYESYLGELCIFDNREDSRTLAQCLAIISQEKN